MLHSKSPLTSLFVNVRLRIWFVNGIRFKPEVSFDHRTKTNSATCPFICSQPSMKDKPCFTARTNAVCLEKWATGCEIRSTLESLQLGYLYISAIDSNGLNVADSKSFLCIFVLSAYLGSVYSALCSRERERSPVLVLPPPVQVLGTGTVQRTPSTGLYLLRHTKRHVSSDGRPAFNLINCVTYGYSLGA